MSSESSTNIQAMGIGSNNRVREIIAQVITIIRSHVGEEQEFDLYLFGSRAGDKHDDRVDIDLALDLQDLPDEIFRRIKREVANIRTLYTIDLVHIQRVDPAFRELILSSGQKIYG
jgi:predicted nucleotidyltransferase